MRHLRLVIGVLAIALCTAPGAGSQTLALSLFERYLETFRRRRELMAQELSRIPGLRFELPAGAFYFFVDASSYGPTMPLCRRILDRRKVITIPGVAFGPSGEGFIRISYAATEDHIVRGVRAIGEELRSS